MTRLSFTREPGYVLRWDVWEVHPTGGKSYSGELVWLNQPPVLGPKLLTAGPINTGPGEWVFQSSDGSICWKLGRNARKAMRILRDRYVPIDNSTLCGCLLHSGGTRRGPFTPT